jgi:hypothetical protein
MKITKISNVFNHEIKTSGGYPFPVYKTTMENSFIFGLILGVKNSGKTNLMLSILDHEPHLLQRGNKIWFISPTVDGKVEKFKDAFPDNFIIVDGLDIETWRQTLNNITSDVNNSIDMLKKIKLLEKYLKKGGKSKLEQFELQLLEDVNYLNDIDFSKVNLDYPNINTIIIDDSLGSPLISGISKQAKEFQRYAIRHRHLFTNLFILSQYPKGISKTLRANANLICMFPMRDQSIYQAIFPEISGLFNGKIQNLIEAMKEVENRNDHSFLTIYYDKIQYVHINFNEHIDFDK